MNNKFLYFIYCLAFLTSLKVYPNVIYIPDIQVKSEEESDSTSGLNGIDINFDQNDISEQGSTSVTDFLSNQNVLQVKNNSAIQDQAAISMRGFGNNASNNSLLLIDDIPVTSFTSIGPNLNSVLINNIDGIQVYPGSYGSLYGNQAVGGVMAIMTKEPGDREISSFVSYGNNNQKQINGFYSERYASNIGFNIGAMASENDNGLPHSLQQQYNINTKLDYISENMTTSFNLLAYQNKTELPQARVYGTDELVPSFVQNSETTGFMPYIKNNINFNKDLVLENDAMFMSNKTVAYLSNASNTLQQNSTFIQSRAKYLNIFNGGLSFQYSAYNSYNSNKDDQANEAVGALFVNADYPVPYLNKLKMIAGGRYTLQYMNAEGQNNPSISMNDAIFVYSLGTEYQYNRNLNFYLRRDTNFSLVRGNELFMTSDGSINQLNNQTGVSYETGLSYQKGGNNLQASFYVLDIDNELAYDPTIGFFGQMTNLPPTRRIGSELNASTYINQYIGLNAQASIVNAEFRSGAYKGNQVPNVSPYNFGIGSIFSFKQWELYLNESYHSSFYASNDLRNQGPRMPGYFLTNLNLKKSFDNFTVNLNIMNLFNKKYVSFADYYDENDIVYYPSAGINILLNLTLKLS